MPRPRNKHIFRCVQNGRLEKQPTGPAAAGRKACLFRGQDIISEVVKVDSDFADSWNMAQHFHGKVTLQDLKPHGLLDLYRQGTTWVAFIRLKNGRMTNLPLEPTVVTRKAALQFLKVELEKPFSALEA